MFVFYINHPANLTIMEIENSSEGAVYMKIQSFVGMLFPFYV